MATDCVDPFWTAHNGTEEVDLCTVTPPTWGFASHCVRFSSSGPYYNDWPEDSYPITHWGDPPQTEYGLPPGSTATNDVVSALGLLPTPEIPYEVIQVTDAVPVYSPYRLPW